MVKNSETDVKTTAEPNLKDQKSGGTFKKIIGLLVVTALFGGASWYLYQNPQLLKQEAPKTEADADMAQLHNKINELQQKLAILESENAGKISGRELNALNERIDTHARLNREILDSKAGNGAILGLVNRIDMLEMRVNNLGKVSSNGALILTAAMLVKDGADNGQSFEYEAEVLRQLAEGTNMQAPAETIALYASEGLPDQARLIDDFNRLYTEHAIATAQNEQQSADTAETQAESVPQESDWKDKINQKLSRLVSVKYHTDDEKTETASVPEDEVYILVNQGKFDQAVIKMQGNPEYAGDDFVNWQKKIRVRDEFEKALRRIQALTLATMKVENLQNKAQ